MDADESDDGSTVPITSDNCHSWKKAYLAFLTKTAKYAFLCLKRIRR